MLLPHQHSVLGEVIGSALAAWQDRLKFGVGRSAGFAEVRHTKTTRDKIHSESGEGN